MLPSCWIAVWCEFPMKTSPVDLNFVIGTRPPNVPYHSVSTKRSYCTLMAQRDRVCGHHWHCVLEAAGFHYVCLCGTEFIFLRADWNLKNTDMGVIWWQRIYLSPSLSLVVQVFRFLKKDLVNVISQMTFVLWLNVKSNIFECLTMKTAGNRITKTSKSPVDLDQRKEWN